MGQRQETLLRRSSLLVPSANKSPATLDDNNKKNGREGMEGGGVAWAVRSLFWKEVRESMASTNGSPVKFPAA